MFSFSSSPIQVRQLCKTPLRTLRLVEAYFSTYTPETDLLFPLAVQKFRHGLQHATDPRRCLERDPARRRLDLALHDGQIRPPPPPADRQRMHDRRARRDCRPGRTVLPRLDGPPDARMGRRCVFVLLHARLRMHIWSWYVL